MKYKYPHALFGNGPSPTHPIVKDRLKSIKTFFCVDGGADKLLTTGYTPDVILGDLDSINKDKKLYSCTVVYLEDQSKNDLEKSISWCISQGIEELELFGFSNGRDDHHLANLFIMENFSNKVKMKMFTDNSLIFCINKYSTFSSKANQTVSIFTFNKKTKITTTGLKYALKNSSLTYPSQGISNLAIGSSFSVTPSDWTFIIINYM
tara:strand:+ start:507 stop:1127 length:621 start_codon:yes stop_codon:yes gene_type:complete